ncbi:malonate--CoA ligase [Sneathiella sp.]|uniref:malonate--CoA ligase n=1 Tax=Sneathiella sp. TaxID=1964365 RepID=UPI002FDFCA79
MTDSNLYRLFETRFARQPDAIAFEGPEIRPYTFRDVMEGSARIAHLLASEGAKPGDRVAVQVGKSVEAVLLYLACLRAGLVYLPLNTAYKSAELDYFISDSEPAVVVCDPAHESEVGEIVAKAGVKTLLTLDESGNGTLIERSAGLPATFETVAREKDDLAAILYTSGTTGRSKGAMLSHDNLASNAITLHRHWQFHPGDVLLHALPIFHVHGLFVALHCVFLAGGKVIFLKKFDSADVIRHFPASTVFMAVPTFYVRLLADPAFTRDACRNMRLFTSGSAPLLEETFNAFTARTGHVILERYGMTEAGMITSNPYDGLRKAGTVGFALDNEARIVDDAGRVVADGEIGILEIRGPNVFKGYWRMPEKTAEEFRPDGFFITGDMTCRDEDGYYRIVGRAKDLIISGGYNVYPKEIESFIDEIPGVGESAVVGVPHPDFGEAVVAFVVPGTDGETLTAAEVIATIKDKIANFKVPKAVYFVPELPRNTMGKVQKNQLRDQAISAAKA